jgi:hypothetical protein
MNQKKEARGVINISKENITQQTSYMGQKIRVYHKKLYEKY